jgi:hypothetical protein
MCERIYDDVASAIPSAIITIRIADKTLPALTDTVGATGAVSMFGQSGGLNGAIYVKKAALPEGVVFKERSKFQIAADGDTWHKCRVKNLDLYGNTILRFEYVDENEA